VRDADLEQGRRHVRRLGRVAELDPHHRRRHLDQLPPRLLSKEYPPITYYWTGFLILDHSYLVGNFTNSEIAETKALEPLKS
jgi:hypothetical protein